MAQYRLMMTKGGKSITHDIDMQEKLTIGLFGAGHMYLFLSQDEVDSLQEIGGKSSFENNGLSCEITRVK